MLDILRRPRGHHFRSRAEARPAARPVGALMLAVALLVGFVPSFGGVASAAEGDPVVTRESGTNGCNGVRPTPGSENTTKRLDPDYPSDLSPGGVVGYIIDFPTEDSSVSGRETFVITDCVFVNGTAVAKYSVSFVPTAVDFLLRFTVPVPADTPLGAQFCNYAKTTAAPSESQASNRKAGPACFTVGGALRIEKRSGSTTGDLLPGASFTVSCAPETTQPPTIITGLSNPSTTSGGVVSASGTAGDGTIAISGPSGTVCTVTETAAPDGFVVDSEPRELVIPVGTSQTINVFVNSQTSSLTVSKTTNGGTGTFTFDLDCDDVGDAFDQSFTIDTSGTVSFDNIPVGTTCTVTETPDPLFISVPDSGTVTVDEDGESISFVNTRRLADLRIVKTTNGGTGTFVFDVNCGGVLSTVEIVDSGVATVAGIPTGTSCTVLERANGDFTSVVVPTNGTVTIDNDGEQVAFTNTRKTGDLVISKTTTGGTGIFTFTVDCTGTTFDRVVTITNTGSNTITGIPTGTTCTVTETADPEFTSTVTPTTGAVVIAVGANPVSFANTAKPAALTVVKTADAASVTSGDTIGFTVNVTSTGTGTARAATLNDPLPTSTGVSWSISPAYAGPGTCAITGAVPAQVLSCSFGDLAPGASATVHVSSPTEATTAGTLANTAAAKATNVPETTASASIVVTPAPPVVLAEVIAAPAELPRTGSSTSGPIRAALALIIFGGLALLPEHLRRQRFGV